VCLFKQSGWLSYCDDGGILLNKCMNNSGMASVVCGQLN